MAELNTLARPYAKAIFELAQKNDSFEMWSSQLQILSQVAKDPRVTSIIADQTLPIPEVLSLVLNVTGSFLDNSGKNLVTILAEKRRLAILPEIASLYSELKNEAENLMDVEFITAVPIDELEKDKFSKLLQKKLTRTIKMHCQVDTNILGGFLAKAGNYVLDGSLKGQLTELKTVMGG